MEFIITDHFIQRIEERLLIEYTPEFEAYLINLITSVEIEKSIVKIRDNLYYSVEINNIPFILVLKKYAEEQYGIITIIHHSKLKFKNKINNIIQSNEKGYLECIKNLEKALCKKKFSFDNLRVRYQELKGKIDKASFCMRLKYLFLRRL